MQRQIHCMPFLSFPLGQLPGGHKNKISSSQRAPQMCTLVCFCPANLCSAVLEALEMIYIFRLCGREQKPVGNVVPDWGLCFPLWHLFINIPIVVAIIITISESLIILIYAHDHLTCETGK